MAKTPKKKMVKATLKRKHGHPPPTQEQELRRALRQQKNITQLCGALQRATLRADRSLTDIYVFAAGRQEVIARGTPSH